MLFLTVLCVLLCLFNLFCLLTRTFTPGAHTALRLLEVVLDPFYSVKSGVVLLAALEHHNCLCCSSFTLFSATKQLQRKWSASCLQRLTHGQCVNGHVMCFLVCHYDREDEVKCSIHFKTKTYLGGSESVHIWIYKWSVISILGKKILPVVC